jgi:mRNA interferase MazF
MDFIEKIKKWFELKIKLCTKDDGVVFKQKEIWWCSLGMNLGEESYGKGEKFARPVLVFKKFTSSSFLGIPLTTHEKKGSWYIEIETLGIKRWVMLNQIRVLDKKRLTNRISAVGKNDFDKIKKGFLSFYSS